MVASRFVSPVGSPVASMAALIGDSRWGPRSCAGDGVWVARVTARAGAVIVVLCDAYDLGSRRCR